VAASLGPGGAGGLGRRRAAGRRTPAPDAASWHADRDALLAELARLPRREQAVLVLRFYEGLSDVEIAETLGCRPGTVRGYASRALAKLRVEFTADGEQSVKAAQRAGE
jgi:DNA-directed RNA polymerase specialized sigma24 family protein